MIAVLLLALAQTPDVLVIIGDDIGWSEMPLLPSVKELADQGTTFTRAYSWPLCSASRLAMLFGQYPRRQGIGNNTLNPHSPTDDRLPLELVCLPESLKAIGYSTTLIGKWHLGRAPLNGDMDRVTTGPYCQGFDRWDAGNPAHIGRGLVGADYFNWSRVDQGDLFTSREYATDAQLDSFSSRWAEAGPKFVVLSWAAAHLPWSPPPGRIDQPTDRGDYEQVVTYLDGAIDDALAQVDLATTFVVFVCDNGTPFDAAPVAGFDAYWKGSVFEGGIRVPLIVAGPGITAGVETERLVSLVDIPATLAEMTGAARAPTWLDSVSFADELGAWTGAAPRAYVMSERYGVESGALVPMDALAVVEEETIWPGTRVHVKLKRIIADTDGTGPGRATDLVYDLITDPHEQSPSTFATLPGSVRARLNAELASLPARAP